jgi:hypothetical protein
MSNVITMMRGDTYPIKVTLTDGSTGLPLDLTNKTGKLTVTSVKDPADDTKKVFDVSGVLTATPADGVMNFTPTSANTAVVGKYYYDIQISGTGYVRTVAKDQFIITQDNTK